ncbi:hypothetical protein MAAFP003_5104 [Mycobacterium ahvazicum]|uniref:Uncharacterized protein n=1 Tax=Mycobacterium ahvazicum TaxID=1964395 RepID=A0A2K4YHZ2_9MYCO|nr:hypothetical protein MAAFP003_5104 [Mycobacterium ahvazicum]
MVIVHNVFREELGWTTRLTMPAPRAPTEQPIAFARPGAHTELPFRQFS